MPELPASARAALWGTAHLSGRVDLDAALRASAPDADHLEGLHTWWQTWASLGERVVLMALPRPGDYGDLPRGPQLRDAALEVGECLFVPGLGGGLVPQVHEYGPEGDRGLAVTWRHYDSDPVAAHVLDAWSIRDAERAVADAVRDATATLAGSATPWASRGLVEQAQGRLDDPAWGLPAGLPPRAARVVATAASVGALARLGLDSPADGLAAPGIAARLETLRRLESAAEHALGRAVCIAALHLAGLRPGRDD